MNLDRKTIFKLGGAAAAVILTRSKESAPHGANIGEAVHDFFYGKPANDNPSAADGPHRPDDPRGRRSA